MPGGAHGLRGPLLKNITMRALKIIYLRRSFSCCPTNRSIFLNCSQKRSRFRVSRSVSSLNLSSAIEIFSSPALIKGMGFANNIKSNAVPEWKDFYVDYDKLRSQMRRKDFRSILYNQLNKVNDFYFLLEKKAVDEKDKIFDDVFTELPDENFEDLRTQTEDTGDEKRTRRRFRVSGSRRRRRGPRRWTRRARRARGRTGRRRSRWRPSRAASGVTSSLGCGAS